MDKTMETSYKISRVILAIITFILFNIIIINENFSWKFIPFVFGAIVFGLSFPSSIISQKLIHIGNNLKNNLLRIFYYIIILPIISFFIFGAAYLIMHSIYGNTPISNEIGTALSQAIMFLFFIVLLLICLILPYIQTIIVLVINRFIKNK